MHLVGERAVQAAARRIARVGSDARPRAREIGRTRPELVAYLVLATGSLSRAARGAAWLGCELACELLDDGTRELTLNQLLDAEARNDELAHSVAAAHPRFADRWLKHGGKLRQRALLRRLADDAISQVPDGERGAVFLAIKTIVDVLDGPRG